MVPDKAALLAAAAAAAAAAEGFEQSITSSGQLAGKEVHRCCKLPFHSCCCLGHPASAVVIVSHGSKTFAPMIGFTTHHRSRAAASKPAAMQPS
jgi:hypothetical protein